MHSRLLDARLRNQHSMVAAPTDAYLQLQLQQQQHYKIGLQGSTNSVKGATDVVNDEIEAELQHASSQCEKRHGDSREPLEVQAAHI